MFILGLLSLSFGAYWYINIVIEEELSKSMLASVGKSAESINRWLATIMLEPETVASTPAAKDINWNFAALDAQNINRHKQLHEKHPDIFKDIYAANREGEYHTVQQNGDTYSIFVGDIQNRPYFQSIMAGGPTQITPPLISRTTGFPTIFMVAPILDDENRPQGLIGAGISLKYIQEIAQELKSGTTGYGFIVTSDGTYIYHPNPAYVMQNSITELDDPLGRELGTRMIAGGSGIFRFESDRQTMVAFFHPIPISGWSVASVLPETELFAPAIRMIRLLAFITVFFVLLAGTAIILAMRHLTQPLQMLAERAEEIAGGNLEVAALEVRSQDEIGMVAQAFNIMTENLKATLFGLRESEDKYRGIFENALEGIFQTSLPGKVLNANPAMARMLGCNSIEELREAYPDTGSDLYVDPEDRKRLVASLREHGQVHDQEVQFYRRDGVKIWVSISASLVRKDSRDEMIEGMISDISARKHAEQEREDLQRQLVQAQKLEAVGQLAGGVAHDFNNMLAVILGLTELALKKAAEDDPLRNSFLEIQNAAIHSSDLTRQLLAFARKQTVEPKVIDLNQAIDGTLNMLRRLIGEDIELCFTPGEGLWLVNMDPAQISQVLTNLCVNARDAISGVGRLVIETGNVTLDAADCGNIPQAQPGDYICLTVSDTGCGMDQETQEHIFEPFYTTHKNRGTGLGLATVYGIVRQNNACIDIQSEPGRGTKVSIFIPRCLDALEPAATPQTEHAMPSGKETVLLVEDEPTLMEISSQMLEGLGYNVLKADLPLGAIQLVEEYGGEIDLLMTDVVMPKMNGRELAQRITEIRPEIKCLFMSGYTADIIATRGVLDKRLNFIQKPFTLQALADKLREVITP